MNRLTMRIRDIEIEQKTLMLSKAEAITQGGGTHENSSWDDIERREGVLQSELSELQSTLRTSQLADAPRSGAIGIGSIVSIKFGDIDQTWQIGGYADSDPTNGIIAYDTPLGSVLYGCKLGDTTPWQGKTVIIEKIS